MQSSQEVIKDRAHEAGGSALGHDPNKEKQMGNDHVQRNRAKDLSRTSRGLIGKSKLKARQLGRRIWSQGWDSFRDSGGAGASPQPSAAAYYLRWQSVQRRLL